jgi:hypothetical protein
MAYSIDKKDIIDYSPEQLKSFHVYVYEWIDNLNFTLDPADCLPEPKKYTDIVREMLQENGEGWDGDGEIKLMWIPPFVFSGNLSANFTKGVVIWHVKQVEDGISWILSPIEFPW